MPAFQNDLQIIPYDAYAAGTPPQPPVGSDSDTIGTEEPLVIVEKMSPDEFFAYGADLMKLNPAHFNDYPILARMARVGSNDTAWPSENADVTPSAVSRVLPLVST